MVEGLEALNCSGGMLSSNEIDNILQMLTSYASEVTTASERGFSLKLWDYVPRSLLTRLICHATQLFSIEPTLVDICVSQTAPIVLYGDIHGDLNQLLYWLTREGYPTNAKLVFLGDYVDRGRESVEVLVLLFLLKIMFSDSIYVLRGNHETYDESSMFFEDCERVLDGRYYDLFNVAFDEMPLALRVASKLNPTEYELFCCHGGVSPWFGECARVLKNIPRGNHRIPFTQCMCMSDLLWSDPVDEDFTEFGMPFMAGERGIGVLYAPEGLRQALSAVQSRRLVRGHQFQDRGFSDVFGRDGGDYGQCLCVHSTMMGRRSCQSAVLLATLEPVKEDIASDEGTSDRLDQLRISTSEISKPTTSGDAQPACKFVLEPIRANWQAVHELEDMPSRWSSLVQRIRPQFLEKKLITDENTRDMRQFVLRTVHSRFRRHRMLSHTSIVSKFTKYGGQAAEPGSCSRAELSRWFFLINDQLRTITELIHANTLPACLIDYFTEDSFPDFIACIRMLGKESPYSVADLTAIRNVYHLLRDSQRDSALSRQTPSKRPHRSPSHSPTQGISSPPKRAR